MNGNVDWSSIQNLPVNAAELSDLLTKRNITVKSVDENGDTFLHFFIRNIRFSQNDILEITKNVLNLGLDPNTKNIHEETFLHLAVARRLSDVIELLLEYKADINVVDNNDNSIAHFFIKDEYHKYMKLDELLTSCNYLLDDDDDNCLDLDLDDDEASLSHIKTSLEKNSADVEANFAEWLISKGFDFDSRNKNGQSALHLSIKYNLQHILQVLLKHTQDINFVSEYDKRTLLHLFIKSSNMRKFSKRRAWCTNFSSRYAVEIIIILLERGVSVDDVDSHELTAIHLAIKAEEDLDIVSMLINRFTKLKDECGESLLQLVVQNSLSRVSRADYYITILQSLIARGVDVNCRYSNQVAPIFYAIKEQNLLVIELLKNAGADFSVTTSDGQNLLHVLAHNENCKSENLFELLINNGCDANAKDESGHSPLHLAVLKGNITMIEKLIAHGVDINTRENIKDWTPLHSTVADRRELTEIVKLLLKNGAKVNSRTRCDGRPIHLAADLKNGRNVLKLLLSRGAHPNARDDFGNTALTRAFLSRSIDNVGRLLEFGADINDHSILRLFSWGYCYSAGRHILKHSIKLKAAGLFYSDGFKSFVIHQFYKDFYEICKKEVDKLKSTHIDKDMTLYQWLHTDLKNSFLHVRSGIFIKTVCSSQLWKEFPQYATVLLAHYRETIARRLLLKKSKMVWLTLTHMDLPDVCIDHIFSKFNNAELVDVVEIVMPDWFRSKIK